MPYNFSLIISDAAWRPVLALLMQVRLGVGVAAMPKFLRLGMALAHSSGELLKGPSYPTEESDIHRSCVCHALY